MSDDTSNNNNKMQSSSPATAIAAAIASGASSSSSGGNRRSGRRSSAASGGAGGGDGKPPSVPAAAAAPESSTAASAAVATSKAGAAARGRGRRTGVKVAPLGTIPTDPTTGFEDLDAFFETNAASAASASTNANGTTSGNSDKIMSQDDPRKAKVQAKIAARQEIKKTKAAKARERAQVKAKEIADAEINFRLADTPGAADASATGTAAAENSDPQKGSSSWAEKMAQATAAGHKLSFSPGDMSRVSSAPPTPFVAAEGGDAGVGDGVGGVGEEVEENVATPEQARRAGDGAGAGSIAGAAHLDVDNGHGDHGDDDDLFPIMDDDDDDLGGGGMDMDMDDSSPPPPEETAEELIRNTSLEEEEAVGGGDIDDGINDIDDDDDDDKDEGVGFQLLPDDDNDVNDDDDDVKTTPEDEEDVANAAKKKKKDKSKNKKKETSAADVVTPDDGKKNGKNKKKRKKRVTYADRVNNFSTPTGKSHGYPAGNRDYQLIPVSDYKENDDDDDNNNNGVRRSKRTKFAPLAYWKNERLAYEAHDEEGTLGEAMGDMPVVAGAIQALPTPYKERKAVPPKKNKSKKRRGKKGANGDDDSYDDSTYAEREIEPFDTKKLRSKYDYIDDEKAVAWDESNEESVERKLVSYTEGRGSWPTCPCPNGARGRARSSPAPPRPSTSPATVRSPGGYPVSSICPPRASRMPNPSAFAPRSSTLRAANPRRWSLPLPTPTRARLSSYPKPPSVSSSPPGICSASPLGICTGLRTIPRPTIASCSGPSSVLLLVMRSGVSDDVLHIYFVYTFVHLVIVNARECCGDISYFEF